MVEQLISHDKDKTISSFEIMEDNVLLDGTALSEAGLLENMAQTAALSNGYEAFLIGETPPLGFIGAVKNLKIFLLPRIGQKIETNISVKHQVLNASIVEAQVFLEKEMIASCELKIFLNPQID